jgi:hypothetical protein
MFGQRRSSIDSAMTSSTANPAGARDTIYLAPSGKSPAYLHHRRNLESPRGEPVAGIFISDLQAPEARHIKDAVAWRCITLAKPAGARPVFMSSDPQRSTVHAILLPLHKIS